MIKVSKFLSSAAFANSLLLISFTLLVVGKAFAVVQDLWISFSSSINLTFALLRARKGIPRTTSMLMSASKKVFLKN